MSEREFPEDKIIRKKQEEILLKSLSGNCIKMSKEEIYEAAIDVLEIIARSVEKAK